MAAKRRKARRKSTTCGKRRIRVAGRGYRWINTCTGKFTSPPGSKKTTKRTTKRRTTKRRSTKRRRR